MVTHLTCVRVRPYICMFVCVNAFLFPFKMRAIVDDMHMDRVKSGVGGEKRRERFFLLKRETGLAQERSVPPPHPAPGAKGGKRAK